MSHRRTAPVAAPLLVVALFACTSPAPPRHDATPPVAVVAPAVADAAAADAAPAMTSLVNPHLETARDVLTRHCAKCHQSSLPTAVPKALKVFTLEDEDFAARMTDAQLDTAYLRLREANSIPRDDVAKFDAFVKEELRRRHAR